MVLDVKSKRLLAVLLLGLLPVAAGGASGVNTWQQRWSGGPYSAPAVWTGRELADGTRMIVGYSLSNLHPIRYDAAGNQLSAVTIRPPFFSFYSSPYPNTRF